MDTCESCRFFLTQTASGAQNACVKNPPSVHFVVVPVADLRAGGMVPAVQAYSGLPTTQPNGWCGAYERKLTPYAPQPVSLP
jgi:hypothetical protein